MELTNVVAWMLLVYGILLIIGGILGFVLPEKPSKISLIAGGISGVLAIVAFQLARGEPPTGGLILGFVVATANEGFMMIRFAKTKKFMPAGLVALLSVAVMIATAVAMLYGGSNV